MGETENTLRDAEALINVEGILAEKKLEKVKDTKGNDVIRGTLDIQVDDTHMIKLNVYASEKTKAGELSKAYPGVETVFEEYQSIAEVGQEAATKVRCRKGSLQPNTYVDKNTGMVRNSVRYSANFLTRVDESTRNVFEPKNEFEVEGFIRGIRPEVNKEGEETGRLIVSLLVPTSRMIEPLDLIAPEELADSINETFDINQTARFYGILENNVVPKEKVIKMAIGKDRVEKSYEYIDERIITGASTPYEDGMEYSIAAIQKAMADREMQIEQMKADAANAKKKVNTPNAAVNQAPSGRPLPKFNMLGI